MSTNNTDKRTIMICDDNKDILTTVNKGLENSGFKVHAFSDPLLALEHVQNGCGDCEMLVTDVRMPNMNGFQLVRRIREIRPDIKVVMMTAFEAKKPEIDMVFPSMHLDGNLSKPFALSKLAEMIKEIYLKDGHAT